MYTKKVAILVVSILLLIGSLAYASWVIPADKNPSINTSINPNVNTTLNPNINTNLNPKLNPSLNPDINKSLNPLLNSNLNPNLNPKLNLKLNPDVNPKINTSLNPKLNSAINPKSHPDNVLFRFDKNLKSSMYIVTVNTDFLLFYNAKDELVLFGVKNSSNGFTVFDLSNRWVEYLINDSVGFLIFSLTGDWIGIVR
jgi:hypothetical protein